MRRVLAAVLLIMLAMGIHAQDSAGEGAERLVLTFAASSRTAIQGALAPRLVSQVACAELFHSRVASWAGLPALQSTPLRLVLLDDRDGPLPPCFVPDERCIYAGARAGADDLAHEIGHAFVHAIKPGYRAGVARIVHEGIADMCAVLCGYLDPQTFARVLVQTGGDLGLGNEAAFVEGTDCCRSALSRLSLQDIGFDPTRVHLPDMSVPGTRSDPHFTSVVLTAALHDLLCGLCESDMAAGSRLDEAIERSAAAVGKLMFRALLFVAEHRVSLQEYASALFLADRVLGDARAQGILAPILVRRGFFGSAEEAEAARALRLLPDFRLDPNVLQTARVLGCAWDLEELFLASVQAVPSGKVLERYRIPLLFHRHERPFPRFVDPLSVRIDADCRTPEDFRLVRLSYICPVDQETERLFEAACQGDQNRIRRLKTEQPAYASCLFDPEGNLIAMNADRPLPQTFFGL